MALDRPAKPEAVRVAILAERAAAEEHQADGDASTVVMYAVNLAMLQDPGGTPSLTPAECFENYADDLLRELGGNAERALAAARAVAAKSVSRTGYPTLWRQTALAVELCQRAAEMTGQVLAARPQRIPSDTFRKPIYDLLHEPPLAGVESLLAIWQQIIIGDVAAARPFEPPPLI